MNNIFYTPAENISDDRLELVGQEAKHAGKVLRYSEGDRLIVVDGVGGFYEGPIHQVNKNSVLVKISRQWQEPAPEPDIRLAFSIIKKRDRLEFAVEKAVELGVRRFYLFPSANSEKNRIRKDRLDKIAMSAMKQSLRPYKPEILEASGMEQIISHSGNYTLLVAHQTARSLSELRDEIGSSKKILLFVGPEGGFTEDEIDSIRQQGGAAFSLGNKRLRAETAVVVGVARLAG